MPLLHTLGDYRDAIEPHASASYPDAGTGTDRARAVTTFGLHSALIGGVSGQYLTAILENRGELTGERLDGIRNELADALFYLTRSIVENATASAGLLWGQSIADLHKPVHVDNPAHAWLAVPRIVVQTDFTRLHDVQILLQQLAYAAARHGWTLQDLALHSVREIAGSTVLQGAA